MIFGIIGIIGILFMLYVMYKLASIDRQLEQISKHLNIEDEGIEKISNEEIEKELEKYVEE